MLVACASWGLLAVDNQQHPGISAESDLKVLCYSWVQSTARLYVIKNDRHDQGACRPQVLESLLSRNVIPYLCDRFSHIYHTYCRNRAVFWG